MEDQRHLPTNDGGRSSRPQKLKDTCDMCSASKVRCDKKKPICSRCERLGYPCFFSPARRIGKRRCIRSPSSGNKLEVSEKSPEPQTITVGGKEDVPPKPNAVDDTLHFGFRHGTNGSSPRGADKPYSSILPGDNTSMPLRNTSHHGNSSSSDMESMTLELGYGQGMPAFASEFDCATVAMNILQCLSTTTSNKKPSTAAPHGETKAPTLDSLISTASMAIKRVSTILICPCSRNPDVGLLAAGVCAALLDTYEVILRNSSTTSSSPKTGIPSSRSSATSIDNGHAERMDMDTGTTGTTGTTMAALPDEPSEKATIMRILEELPKVANLVTQFTRRYGQDAERYYSRDLPQALAASITSRLKAMIDEVTSWVAQI